MTHRISIRGMHPKGEHHPAKVYDIEVDDPMAAHSMAMDRYKAEVLGGVWVPGMWFVSGREEVAA